MTYDAKSTKTCMKVNFIIIIIVSLKSKKADEKFRYENYLCS